MVDARAVRVGARALVRVTVPAHNVRTSARVLVAPTVDAQVPRVGARSLTRRIPTVALGTATETDTAGPLTAARAYALGTATETDTAQPLIQGGQSQAVTLDTAAETDTAGTVAYVPSSFLGTAGETDTAGPLTVMGGDPDPGGDPGNLTGDTDTANRVNGRARSGYGDAVWEPSVVPVPPALAAGRAVVVAQAFGPVTVTPAGPAYDVTLREKVRPRDRILIGGVDVTYFRGVATPFPGYALVEPFLYGPTSITLPQVSAAFERPGVGALRWCRPWAPVVIQRVDPDTGEVIAVDYRGLVVGYGASGASLTLDVGGELTGRAAMHDKQVPIFNSRVDLGRMVYNSFTQLSGVRLEPRLGPETGITAFSFGGTSYLEALQKMVAMSYARGGGRWTVMPDGPGVYRMRRKDTTTVHGTAYADDTRVVANLDRDLTEEPNRIFMTGVTPQGQRVKFGAYPGLKQSPVPPYPYTNGRTFGPGTTDADTDTGDGVTLLIVRLRITKYLDPEDDTTAGYTQEVARGIRELQRDAGLPVTGDVTPATWAALYDLSATGFSLRWSAIQPAADRSVVRRWRRSASGAQMSKNPGYDPNVPKVDRSVDAGVGFDRSTLREWARTELDEASADNWVGSIAFPLGALVSGAHTPGEALPANRVMNARDLRPGMNLRLPLFDGGITVHVAAASVSTDGVVTAEVDTRARDAMEVWEVIARNRESRQSPYRSWVQQQRQSEQTKDALTGWDEVGGILYAPVPIYARRWNLVPVVAGQAGQVAQLRLAIPGAEYTVAVFGRKPDRSRLRRLLPDPLAATPEGEDSRWDNEDVRDALDRMLMLYAAGDAEQPCGYFPRRKRVNGTAPVTGRWEDDAGFSYMTPPGEPVLWLAIWPRSPNLIDPSPDLGDFQFTVRGGRVLWPQLEGAV